MSLVKIIDNSDIDCPNQVIVVCDYCGIEFTIGDPHLYLENKDLHICTKCIEKISEWFVSNHFGYPGLLWLKAMENKYYNGSRKKRKCYLPKKLRQEILNKYNFSCVQCGAKNDLSIDHIKPVILGGDDSFENLQVLCRSCNSKKGKKYAN